MEVSASEWEKKAIANITRYVHRGGECKGDEPQLIGGTTLLNTIGICMGLPISDPDKWTTYEKREAARGNLVFYEDEAREAIDVVANQIRSCCGGDDENFVTILPVELYHGGKLYELPLFRVTRYRNSKIHYIDNIGRRYQHIGDWYGSNKLPPGEMACPEGLKLSLRPGSEEARVWVDPTPVSRIDARAMRGLDTTAALAGLGSSVALLFVSGGLAAPLVVTSLAAAGWGTTRAGYHIGERAVHGETVNPFTDSDSRMLWLGVAANLTSFGAMGASMRLSELAVRGQEISKALKIATDIANGANVAVSGLAIINTSIVMYNNRNDLTAVDVLMHGASVAFWTKGIFTYKSANTIIKESQNYAFKTINKELSKEQASKMSEVRSRFGDDPSLLRQYMAAMKKSISTKDFSQILIDGLKYSDIVSNLNDDQIKAFNSISSHLRDDVKLITGIRKISEHYNINPSETIENIINKWQGSGGSTQVLPIASDTMLRDGNLILGRAPPIRIADLPQLSAPMIRFLGDLSQIEVSASGQWSTSGPVLLSLQEQGLFTVCPVAYINLSGNAVVSLNSVLNISIYKLNSIPNDECGKLLQLVGNLPPAVTSKELPKEVRTLCVVRHRLRFEFQRNESVDTVSDFLVAHKGLQNLVKCKLQSHERDRLYTFANTIDLNKADSYKKDMLIFVNEMNPTNVSELVAYSEFAMNAVQHERVSIKLEIQRGTTILPKNEKLSVWTHAEARRRVFGERGRLARQYARALRPVRERGMAGAARVPAGLADAALVAAARRTELRFANEASAAYHSEKHPTDPKREYVSLANATVRDGAARVSLTQDGDARSLTFDDGSWKAVVLERDGRLVLATYMPNN